MKLKVILPTKILLNEEVSKVIAEAENGSFCLLPRHIDFVTTLVPGILAFVTVAGEEKEKFLAVDEGILIKRGGEVLVSTQHAVKGDELEILRQTVEKQFRVLDEREKQTRSVLAKLEASSIRAFINLGEGS